MKDANGQQFWQLARASDWRLTDARVEYDADCRHLRLRDRRPRRASAGTPVVLDADKEPRTTPARVLDPFGTTAWWDGTIVQATGALRSAEPPIAPVELWRPSAGTKVHDLALGFDDILYVAATEPHPTDGDQHVVRLIDRRERWLTPVAMKLEAFAPQKFSADPSGGVWALDVSHRLLARLRGLPLRDFQRDAVNQFSVTTFRPVPEDPSPLRMELIAPPAWVGAEIVVAFACSPEGRLAILTWRGENESWLYLCDTEARWLSARRLAGTDRPFSIAWLSTTRLAALPAPREIEGTQQPVREALVFSPDDETAELEPAGDFYPLRDFSLGPWVHGIALPPHYPVGESDCAPLVALSGTTFERIGVAAGRVIDSGAARPTWHRLNVEALIPPGCGFVVELATTESANDTPEETDWFEHHFGTTPATSTYPLELAQTPNFAEPPRGVLLDDGSDQPLHPGLLGDDAEDEMRGTLAGTFTALIQRTSRRVRALRGRCLHVRVRLFGPGHATSRIYSLRAWGSRFSYRDRYLAELYREEVFGDAADKLARPTSADFLDRFLGLFESVFTPLEDRVAAAHIVTDPSAAPEDALDWLGAWIGEVFDADFPPSRRRAWLEAASWLHRAHGTLSGLQLALELGTGGRMVRALSEEANREVVFPFGGGVTGGEIVVLEEFRLRRTMASILGANLNVGDDPLLPGLITSTNSIVGDTLVLGEEEKKEFIALFRSAFSENFAERAIESEAVAQLFDRFAHRVTVLVHQDVEQRDLALIRRIAERMAPAHVVVTVLPASYPLLVGLASLVEVDTYLVPRPPREFARLNVSRLGGNAFVKRLPTLDPRLGGGRRARPPGPPAPVPPPQARIAQVEPVKFGQDLTLDGSLSSAAPGHSLTDFEWGWRPGS